MFAFDEIKKLLNLNENDSLAHAMRNSAEYKSALPFPHIVIDDFLPEVVAEALLASFPSVNGYSKENHFQKNKVTWHPEMSDCSIGRQVFASLNSRQFLCYLTALTGVENLMPDPYFLGSGYHSVSRGGYLSIHADFNMHQEMRLERKLNFILYLNKNWAADFNGNLELWSRDGKRLEKSILPIWNRAVIFNTDLDAFHGHPDPLACPEDRARMSVSQYYYHASERDLQHIPKRSAHFIVRPKSADKYPYTTAFQHLLIDLLPPIFYRLMRSFYRSLKMR